MERKATLIPKIMTIRFEDNRISICYRINDDFTGIGIGETFINFSPSNELMNNLKNEIDQAIKTKN